MVNNRYNLREYGAAKVAGMCECQHQPILEWSGPYLGTGQLKCYCGKQTDTVNYSANKYFDKWQIQQELVKQWRKLPKLEF